MIVIGILTEEFSETEVLLYFVHFNSNTRLTSLKCKNVEYNKLRFSILLKNERVKDDIFNHFLPHRMNGDF
jgi:hypothetical protein